MIFPLKLQFSSLFFNFRSLLTAFFGFRPISPFQCFLKSLAVIRMHNMAGDELFLRFDCQIRKASFATARIVQEISRNCGKLLGFLMNLAFFTR